jgi:hypothetical protein
MFALKTCASEDTTLSTDLILGAANRVNLQGAYRTGLFIVVAVAYLPKWELYKNEFASKTVENPPFTCSSPTLPGNPWLVRSAPQKFIPLFQGLDLA